MSGLAPRKYGFNRERILSRARSSRDFVAGFESNAAINVSNC